MIEIVRLIIFAFAFMVIIVSCKKDCPPPAQPTASKLTGCCEMPATNASFGNGKVYIPNIFTPNEDGINDLFVLLGDSVKTILYFEVTNDSNQTVYLIENIPYDEYKQWVPYEFYWDGNSNGELIPGLYLYTATLEAEDGTIGAFEGKVCNYPCEFLGNEEMISVTGCQFPANADHGQYNPNFHTGESSTCFK